MQEVTLYDRIKELATIQKKTIRQIERETGLDDGHIKKWKVFSPNSANLIAVADCLGVSIDTLVGRASGEYLAEDERKLLALFRSMNAEGRAFLMQSAEMASTRFLKTPASDREVTA